jgi:ubiquinone/menaquinone biosynthesis C-methylase UbiE
MCVRACVCVCVCVLCVCVCVFLIPPALSQDMYLDGFTNSVSVDFSPVVIEHMAAKHRHLTFLQMDVRNMSELADHSFDYVVDKGTLDALLCGSDCEGPVQACLQEVARVLKPGGVYAIVSFGCESVDLAVLFVFLPTAYF